MRAESIGSSRGEEDLHPKNMFGSACKCRPEAMAFGRCCIPSMGVGVA